jgi:hypothetical protein
MGITSHTILDGHILHLFIGQPPGSDRLSVSARLTISPHGPSQLWPYLIDRQDIRSLTDDLAAFF